MISSSKPNSFSVYRHSFSASPSTSAYLLGVRSSHSDVKYGPMVALATASVLVAQYSEHRAPWSAVSKIRSNNILYKDCNHIGSVRTTPVTMFPGCNTSARVPGALSLIHISEPTRPY